MSDNMIEQELVLDLQNGLKNKIDLINHNGRISIDMVNIPRKIKKSFMKQYGEKYANNVVEPILKEFKNDGIISDFKMSVNKKNKNQLTVMIKK